MVAQWLFQLWLAAILGATYTATVHAAKLQPVEANMVSLGPVSVIAYYSSGPRGLDLVATAQLDEAEAAVPLHFTATLAPGQRVTISVPRDPGESPLAVELVRTGDDLEVKQTSEAGFVQLIP
jgi:hypothetical protein